MLRPLVLQLALTGALAGPSCTPNPSCKLPTPGKPPPAEPGCKACVAPASSFNCAACCPGYTMARSGPPANVSYCAAGKPAAPRPALAEAFSSLRADSCGGGFPGCPAEPTAPAGATFEIFTALDVPGQKGRVGPWTRLPKGENQIVVSDYAAGVERVMFVDANVMPPRILNCTRRPGPRQSVELMRETWVGNFATKPSKRQANVSCGWPTPSSVCEQWEWDSTFGVGCPDGTSHVGQEPERWLVPSGKMPNFPAGVAPLVAMTNDVYAPGCGGTGPGGAASYKWYHVDWSRQFNSPPIQGVFDVPPDSQCPEIPAAPAPAVLGGAPVAAAASGHNLYAADPWVWQKPWTRGQGAGWGSTGQGEKELLPEGGAATTGTLHHGVSLNQTSTSCTTAMDCSLSGECMQGACVCDKTWAGPNCAALNLLPANRSEGMHQPSYASWGGLPVEEAGQFHLFFADFTLHCGLGSWGTNSQVSRAVSDHPAGPYTKVEVLAEPFHHNPTIAKAPDGTLLMVSIGNGSAGAVWPNGSAIPAPHAQTNCTAPTGEVASGRQSDRASLGDTEAGEPCEAGCLGGVITALHSKSVKGPWTQLPGVVVEPGAPGSWDDFITNPSVFFFPNGTGLMAYRGGPTQELPVRSHDFWKIGMAVTDGWDKPFKRVGAAPISTTMSEDPGIFQDHRGNFHLITHLLKGCPNKACGGPGGHFYSPNGLDWTFAGQAYGFELTWDDGTKEHLSRRERPQVLMVKGKPSVLFTGAQPQKGFSYTLAQRIVT